MGKRVCDVLRCVRVVIKGESSISCTKKCSDNINEFYR